MAAAASAAPSFEERLSLTLLVDKDRNRVVFAESDHEMVDVLLGFLTLPMGSVVRLLNKTSSLGCTDALYDSVERLSDRFFRTPACKPMLLRPRSAAAEHCEDLAVALVEPDSLSYYRCSALKNANCGFSSVALARCRCGHPTDVLIRLCANAAAAADGGVFVRSASFMITDDLRVKPASMTATLELLGDLRIQDGSVLEKRTVEVGKAEVLHLLKRALVSKMPLTDIFLKPDAIIAEEQLESMLTNIIHIRPPYRTSPTDSKKIHIKLFVCKDSDKVVYAEAGEDLVDQLFGFLTLPLGSIVKLLEKNSSIGSIDNIYNSAELLSSTSEYMKPMAHEMLLSPKLAPFYGSSNQLLKVKEMPPKKARIDHYLVHELDPKLKNSADDENSGGFAKEFVKFMVTDEMQVTPLSLASGVHIINKQMASISSVEQAEASIGQQEAMDLLRACLTSRAALSNAFSPALLTSFERNWYGQPPRNCKP